MIDRKVTIEKFGYDPNDLKPKSNKKIIAVCDKCGKIRELYKHGYHKLCKSCARIGIKFSKDHRIQISISKLGEKNPMFGKDHSGEKNPMFGKYHSEKTKKMWSDTRVGENASNWKGGISFGKYCKLFNESFKIKIRNDYNNRCFICGMNKEENGRNLDVHHVNYNKDCLCGIICEFVPLCQSCHSKTNSNRKYWEDLIMCYLHPEQYFIIDI